MGGAVNHYNLGFISDVDLFNHVKDTVEQYRFDIDLKGFNKNLIDPIKLTFDSLVYSMEIEEIVKNEVLRQIDKSNTNQIGYFHQNIFKYIGEGWNVPKTGFDVIHAENHYFVEMKNKHNTMNSASSQKTYMKMQSKLLEDDEAVCLLVEVIAKASQDKTWQISLDGKNIKNKRIKRVSMDKFYELVTGDGLAFKKLCEALPSVLEDVVTQRVITQSSDTVITELNLLSNNPLKSLYLLAFSHYEGFDEFNV
ncbi:MAG: Eco47II family restriction endonuclease [Gammaproteobacteria bacterium]|nr:Eco47II family restriction endonuclease [Gammaproteobacteria bacterium]